VSWSWSSDGNADFSDVNSKFPTVTNYANGETFTVIIADINGCISFDTTTIVVNDGTFTPPANENSTVECPADATDPGPPADVTDTCGNTVSPVLVGSSESPDPVTCEGTKVWTYRYTTCGGVTTDQC
jgi:hypothetical protein